VAVSFFKQPQYAVKVDTHYDFPFYSSVDVSVVG